MTNEFIPYEQALALKQLGFDEPCFANYTVILEDEIDWFAYKAIWFVIPEQGITDKTSFGSSKNYNSKSFEEEGIISAPTFSQAFRWFREKYDLRIWIESNRGVLFYEYIIATTNPSFINRQFTNNEVFDTYEEAEQACLNKLIDIVKTT